MTVAALAGLAVYVATWVLVGDVWVSRALDDFLRAYERRHRTKVLSRRDTTGYGEGWKLLTGTVDAGYAWSTRQTDPELETLRQRWLVRRRLNFLGPLTAAGLTVLPSPGSLELLAAILPLVLSVLLVAYVFWPDLRSRWLGQKKIDERPHPDVRLDMLDAGRAVSADIAVSDLSSSRRVSWREVFLVAVVAILVVALGSVILARLPVPELAAMLPYGFAVLLVGYFVWPLLPGRWFGRKEVDDLANDAGFGPSGTGPVASADRDVSEVSEVSEPRRPSLRREILAAALAIPFVAALIYAAIWFSATQFVGPPRP